MSIHVEQFAGTIDGANKVFTASNAYVAGTLHMFVNGVLRRISDDDGYAETDPTMGTTTLKVAPIVGDNVSGYYDTASIDGAEKFEVPTGTIDGANQVFTTSVAYTAGSVAVWINGVLRIATDTDGWTETSPTAGTITLTTAPIVGDDVQVYFLAIPESSAQDHLEIPVGAVDGANQVFTTSESYASGSLHVWINGVLRLATNTDGWTETSTSAGTVTLKVAPIVGDTVQIFFLDTDLFVKVTSADVWARDLLEVNFSHSMKNNTDLSTASNYTVTPDTSGQAVSVLSVQVGKNVVSTSKVYLEVTPLSQGDFYTVTVSPTIVTTDNIRIESDFSTAQLKGRRTKIDSMVLSRPKMYDTRVTSLIRKILNAIGREDDLIGGSRDDTIT